MCVFSRSCCKCQSFSPHYSDRLPFFTLPRGLNGVHGHITQPQRDIRRSPETTVMTHLYIQSSNRICRLIVSLLSNLCVLETVYFNWVSHLLHLLNVFTGMATFTLAESYLCNGIYLHVEIVCFQFLQIMTGADEPNCTKRP